MKQNELPLLPEQRQVIHDIILLKHFTGLSPPEDEILDRMEAQEHIFCPDTSEVIPV